MLGTPSLALQSLLPYPGLSAVVGPLSECRAALRVIPRSTDLSRPRRVLYDELVEGVVKDPLCGLFGLSLAELRSFWSWAPAVNYLMFTLLRQHRLRWLGHVHRMPDSRIPKDLLYGELAAGRRPAGRPQQVATERRAHRKQSDISSRPETENTCDLCNRDCLSRVGLYSHRRRQADNLDTTYGQPKPTEA